MLLILEWIGWGFMTIALAGAMFAMLAAWMARRNTQARSTPSLPLPAVTLLKPLHFDEPGLEENLRTFCRQDYAAPVQIVFGVQDPLDPAIAIAQRILNDHPHIDGRVVIDSRLHGANLKVSNIVNMMPHATHDVLVLSDSDISVAQDYLSRVVESLSEDGVGAVTCFYVGKPMSGFWSQVSAMGIDYHFLANVIFGLKAGLATPCFGSTIALHRHVLKEIGGFEAFLGYLADDYEIGRAVSETGRKVAIPHFAVAHVCAEASGQQWLDHELRWARTIRTLNRTGHFGSLITHPLPMAVIATAFLGFSTTALMSLTLVLSARLFLKLRMDRAFVTDAFAGPVWLLPLRDMLSFVAYIGSFFGAEVSWRGTRFKVAASGSLSHSKVGAE